MYPASDPATVAAANCPCRLPFRLFRRLLLRLLSTVTFPTYSPGISRPSIRTSRVFD